MRKKKTRKLEQHKGIETHDFTVLMSCQLEEGREGGGLTSSSLSLSPARRKRGITDEDLGTREC